MLIRKTLLLFFVWTSVASSAETKIDGSVIFQYIGEDNRDLGYNDQGNTQSFSEQLQMRYRRTLDKKRYIVANGRVFNINSSGLQNSIDEGDPSNPIVSADDSFLELRELYYGQKDIGKNLELRIGRQRIREPRSLWWNSDNDLVAIYYKDKSQKGFVAAGEDLGSYRLGMEELPRDEKRFRIIGEYSRAVTSGLTLEPRFVFEHDHSGKDNISSLQTDIDDLTGLYAGIRAAGTIQGEESAKLFYRADIMGVTGRQYVEAIDDENTLSAWAMDYGVSVMPWKDGIVLNANIAFASGDSDDQNKNEFRQTGLEGGSSRSELERTAQRNYGEVLRPELSNIQVISAGVVYPVHPAWEFGLSYYHYTQMKADDNLRRAGLRADPDGNSTDLGQEVDVTVVGDLDSFFPKENRFLRGIQWRSVGGVFDPGDAFENGNDDPALRVFSELRLRF